MQSVHIHHNAFIGFDDMHGKLSDRDLTPVLCKFVFVGFAVPYECGAAADTQDPVSESG